MCAQLEFYLILTGDFQVLLIEIDLHLLQFAFLRLFIEHEDNSFLRDYLCQPILGTYSRYDEQNPKLNHSFRPGKVTFLM